MKTTIKATNKLTAAMSEMDKITPRPLTHQDYANVAISEITKLSNISGSDDQNKMNEIIAEITVNPANLQHIIETGKINGNMLREICHAMAQYGRYRMDTIISNL
jgi:uncharacterized surface protein with fasciclin (FAS1) repeats